MGRDTSARKTIARRVLEAFAGFVAAVLVWHLIVSLLVWRPTGYRDHEDLGRIYRSGRYLHGTEGFSRSTINSLGMRAPEVTPKRDAECRVLFLGDSFTEGFQVPSQLTFAERTEALLRDRGISVRAVNAGRSGASPATYLRLASWYRRNVEPDFVVIQLSDEDLSGDITNPAANFYITEDSSGRCSAQKNEQFRSAHPIVQKYPITRLALEWPLFRVAAENARKVVASQDWMPTGTKRVAGAPDEVDPALIDYVMREIAGAYENPIIVYLPTVDYEGDLRKQTEACLLAERTARRYDVPFVDGIRDRIADAYLNEARPSHGFANTLLPDSGGHLNAAGHEIVARAVSDALAEEITQ